MRVEIVKLNKGDEPVPDIEDVPLDVNAAVRAKSSEAKRSEAKWDAAETARTGMRLMDALRCNSSIARFCCAAPFHPPLCV